MKWFRATPDTMLDSRVEIKRRKSTSLQAMNAGEGVEKREPSYTVDGNAN